MNCPLCDKVLQPEQTTGPPQSSPIDSYYCSNFFCHIVQTNNENKIRELYLYQKPIIIYFENHIKVGPVWSAQINGKIIHKEYNYLSVQQAKQQFQRYAKLLPFL